MRVDRDEAQRVLDETVTPALAAPVAVVSEDGATSAEVPVAAIAASLTFTPEDDGELAVAIDPAALQTALGDELAAFGSPAKDADFEVVRRRGHRRPLGRRHRRRPADARRAAAAACSPSPAPRSVTAELGPVPADFTTEEAAGARHQGGDQHLHDQLHQPGQRRRTSAWSPRRSTARWCMPGETFSLNTFTGPRGTAQGYVPASVISGGELSKAVGGGISQFATTMFNAVFFAGLEDVYHKPHSFYISRYPAGREATVYEGQSTCSGATTATPASSSTPPGRRASITVTFYGTKRYEIEAISGPRTNYRAAGRPGEARRRRVHRRSPGSRASTSPSPGSSAT